MSLSKLGLPGVRTGIVIAREEIVDMVARVNAVMSLAPGGVGTALIMDLIRSGEIIHMSRDVIRPFYEQKMQEAVRQVHESFRGVDYHLHKPEGAFFLWLWFPNLPITSQQLYERLKQRNVLVVPGHYSFPGLTEPWPHTNECIRVSYAQDLRNCLRGHSGHRRGGPACTPARVAGVIGPVWLTERAVPATLVLPVS